MVAASDRVPCPQCGGLIHPIAGRCKFCKADLATLRGNRPAAAAALPSLAAMTAAANAAPRHAAAPIAPLVYDDSQPVLPPRTTARQLAVEPERAWWKSWPIIVIVLASLAIVIAVILLLWPSHKTDGKHLDQPPPPAPDRMDTSPLVPGGSPPSTGSGSAGATDPWQGKADPNPKGGKLPPPDPIPPSPPTDPDDDTLGLGGGVVGGGLGGLGSLGSVGMMGAMVQHGCTRMATCSSDATVKMLCAQLTKTLGHSATQVPSCAAATRCLAKLDKLDCDTKPDDFAKILGMSSDLEDCVDAMQCS